MSNKEEWPTPNTSDSQPGGEKVAHRFMTEHNGQVGYTGEWSKGHVQEPRGLLIGHLRGAISAEL